MFTKSIVLFLAVIAATECVSEQRSCPIQGQVYQRCRTCPATCSKPDLVCTLQCEKGCGCPTGQLIDTVNRKCVHPKQCPPNCAAVLCLRPECPPGVKIITPPGQCSPICEIKSCQIKGQVFTTCGTACPPTCRKPGPVICTKQCVVGCQCPKGTVLDEVQKKCVKQDQCTSECPPTCSYKFCSNPRNKYKPCSRPPPFTVPPCPDKCRTTYCNACYYSVTATPTPTRCSKICKFPPSPRCLWHWSLCVRYFSNLKQSTKISDNFRCYEYPCPLRG